MKQISPSRFRNRIAEHFEELDLDVSCRKNRSGYTLYWDDGHEPLAKLRPTGKADEVEVYSWEGGRWLKIDDGPPVLPLDEALAHITDDLDDVRFEDEREAPGPSPSLFHELVAAGIRTYCGRVLIHSMAGGAVGGVFFTPLAGAASGALVAMFLGVGIRRLFRGRIKEAAVRLVMVGVPAGIPAATGGALAANVHATLGGGVGWLLCAILTGALCSLFVLAGFPFAWVLGLLASVTVGIQFVDILGLTSETLRYALVGILAIGNTKVCGIVSSLFSDLCDKLTSEQEHKR